MKTLSFISLILAILVTFHASADMDEEYLILSGQQYTYVNTKGGKAVLVYVNSETDSLHKADWLDECLDVCPNVTILSEATNIYNCHNYAWYMTEGHPTSKYWMEPVKPITQSANVSKFWTNDAFEEATSLVYDKIVYYNSTNTSEDENITHSAVVSSVPGYYESKWGNWPLVRHLPDEVPPDYGTIKRYFKPIAPSIVYGPLTCSNGNGEIGVNVSANYTSSVSNIILSQVTNISYVIEYGNNNDAIERGYAVINSQSDYGMNVKFTRQGIYEMYIRYYNKYEELLGEYLFEAVVVL
jgi:hypothetical protein